MKFDWSEYFKLAQELAAMSGDSAASQEARLRSAISRAYYSVFCIARNYLRDVEGNTRISRNKTFDLNEHQYVAEEFVFHPSKQKRMTRIGRNLRYLRQIRNKADYADRIFNLPSDAKDALKTAEKVMKALSELNEEAES